MKPTNQLRFVERTVEINGDHKLVRILQQRWVSYWWPLHQASEWRDVPLEQE